MQDPAEGLPWFDDTFGDFFDWLLSNLQTCRRAKRAFDVIFERLAMLELLTPCNVQCFNGAQYPMFERRAENCCFVALQKLFLSSFLRRHQWIAVDCPTHGSTHPKLVSASSSVIAQLAELPTQRRRIDQISGISGWNVLAMVTLPLLIILTQHHHLITW